MPGCLIRVVKSLNIGMPKKEIFKNREITTGIAKTPITHSVHLGKCGFTGDGVADLKHHGGQKQVSL
ncbi:hypothetical protein QUF76_10885 [Desulfobacterales bacterium HSG16]|nr:hypothetical protein [Desulfobacterales bacterium HSG16]